MAESVGKRRSARTRLPSLKAELNESSVSKVAATPPSSRAKRCHSKKLSMIRDIKYDFYREGESFSKFRFAGEDIEEECQENKVKGRKRQRRSRSSSSSPEVKVQKIEGEAGDGGEGVEGDLEQLNEEPMEIESGRGLPTEGYWAHYQSLCLTLPGRERQIKELLMLFGNVSQ